MAQYRAFTVDGCRGRAIVKPGLNVFLNASLRHFGHWGITKVGNQVNARCTPKADTARSMLLGPCQVPLGDLVKLRLLTALALFAFLYLLVVLADRRRARAALRPRA